MNNKLKLAFLTSVVITAVSGSASMVQAAPASSKLVEFKQGDGTSLWVRKWGDEFAHGWETAEGLPVLQDEISGDWYLVQVDDQGYQRKTEVKVTHGLTANIKRGSQRIQGEAQRRSKLRRVRAHQKNLFARSKVDGSTVLNDGASLAAINKISGTVDVPVLMVNFSDRNTTASRDDFDQFLFQDPAGLTAYYQEVSYGNLSLSGGDSGVIDWVKLSNTHDFYGRNNSAGYDGNIGIMIENALDIADANIDFSQYADINQDCQVDLISFIYQGNGEHQTVGENNDIWAHKYSMYWLETEGDGEGIYQTNDQCIADPSQNVKVNDYFVAPELSNAGERANVGTFAHEFGHVFGLPDLYDTGGNDSGQTAGAGDWSLMASGSKTGPNRDGESPAHLSAWGKYTLGWISPIKLNGVNDERLTIDESVNHPQAYLYENPSDPQEYFIIENRNQQGFDAFSPGRGLAIWHIDDAISAPNPDGSTQGGVNAYPCDLGYQDCTSKHNGVQLVSADYYFDLEHDFNDGDIHDLFGEDGDGGEQEYSTDQDWDTEFSSRSMPSSRWWDNSESGLELTNISAKSEQMSFSVGDGASLDEIVLKNGVAVILSADENQVLNGYIDIPQGATGLQFVMTHNAGGDADLYVNLDTLDVSSNADCFLNTSSDVETCTEAHFGLTQLGRYFFAAKGYNGQSFADVSLIATYNEGDEPPTDIGHVTTYEVNVANGEYQHFSVSVPAGSQSIEVSLDENDGSALLMINANSQASARTYTERDNNGEWVSVDNPDAGNWFVAVRGRNNGVTNGELTITIK